MEIERGWEGGVGLKVTTRTVGMPDQKCSRDHPPSS
jgi:hypothetical protein